MKLKNKLIENGRFKTFLRCINKDSLDYVDVITPYLGTSPTIRSFFLEHADQLSGHWDYLNGPTSKPRVFHYYYICCFDHGEVLNINGDSDLSEGYFKDDLIMVNMKDNSYETIKKNYLKREI